MTTTVLLSPQQIQQGSVLTASRHPSLSGGAGPSSPPVSGSVVGGEHQAQAQEAKKAGKPSAMLATARKGVTKAWAWANKSPLRQFLLGVAGVAIGATISAATGGALGLVGLPFILTGAYMVIKAVSKVGCVDRTLAKFWRTGSSEDKSQVQQNTPAAQAPAPIKKKQD